MKEDRILNRWNIKNEEIHIKTEDGDRSEKFTVEQIEIVAKTENGEVMNKIEKIDEGVLNDWKIKHEEVDIKDEPNETSLPSISVRQQKNNGYTEHKGHIWNNRVIDEFSLKTQLLPHKKSKNILNCNNCDYRTVHKRNLKVHLLLRHMIPDEVDMFRCDQCGYQTVLKSNLKQHLFLHKKHKETDVFRCDQCDFGTVHKRSLNEHLSRHKDPEKVHIMFKCDECDYQTVHRRYLKQHHLRHERRDEVYKLKCYQCDYQTTRKSNLRKHVRRHLNLYFQYTDRNN